MGTSREESIMDRCTEISRKAIKNLRLLKEGDGEGCQLKAREEYTDPIRKQSVFPNGSNSPLWFFWIR